MKPQIMLDIETLGTRPGSVITSIGAVKFAQGEITSDFYVRIDMQSSVEAGLVIDPATLLWWLQRSEKARSELLLPSVPLRSALEAFSVWVGDPDSEVWGCGVGFDNVLLTTAYSYLQLPPPWKHWGDRCYRTLKNLHPTVTLERTGTHHHALDDARHQAMHLMKILNDSRSTTATASEELNQSK